MLDKLEVLKIAEESGKDQAENILLLAGADGFEGSYYEYQKLMNLLQNKA